MGRSFGFSESRIFAQHQNWEAVEEGVLCEQEKYVGECEAVSASCKLYFSFEDEEWPFNF